MTLQKWIKYRAIHGYPTFSIDDAEFINDMQSLLRPGISFNACDAYPLIYETFIDRIEGKRE